MLQEIQAHGDYSHCLLSLNRGNTLSPGWVKWPVYEALSHSSATPYRLVLTEAISATFNYIF